MKASRLPNRGAAGGWAAQMLRAIRTSNHPPATMSLFRGIVPPLVTPLRGPNELDEEGYCRLIDHVIAGGVHEIFILGTTGEGPSLSVDLQHHAVSVATRHAAGRVPVLVGITHRSNASSQVSCLNPDEPARSVSKALAITSKQMF